MQFAIASRCLSNLSGAFRRGVARPGVGRPGRRRASRPRLVRSAVETLEGRCLFAAGALDPSWGVGGLASVDVPNARSERFDAIDVANGRTVIGGVNSISAPAEAVLAVLDSNGQLIKSFSNDGIETKALSVPGGVIDLVVQPDNKIVVVGGIAGPDSETVVLARFNTNGLLDTSFGGGDGQVPLPFGRAVALAGGKIVVAGRQTDGRFGVARYTASGAADGQVLATFADADLQGTGAAFDVAVQPDGKVILAGEARVDADSYPFVSSDAVVVRFNTTLTGIDASFGGGDGVVRFDGADDTETSDAARAVTLDAQGRIVTASRLASSGPIIHRLLPDGSPDPTFGTTDVRFDALSDDVHVGPDGKIVVSGLNFFGGELLARVNAGGGLDATFGGGDGYIQTWDDGPVVGRYSDLQPDGRIITVGGGSGDPVYVSRHLVSDDAGTTVTLRATADAYVRDGSTYAGQNFGGATQLQVKQGAAGWNRHSYLRFDLSSVSTVNSAKLRLFGRLDNTSAASAGFTVYRASNTTWSETGLTWNNKPASGTTVRGSGTVTGTTGKWYELDLTAFLKSEKAAGRHVVTLVIKASAASPSTILFGSDEAVAGTRPELVVA